MHVYAVYLVPCALIMMSNWIYVLAQMSYCDDAVQLYLYQWQPSYCCSDEFQHAWLLITLRNMVFSSVIWVTHAAEEEAASAAICLCIGLHGACCCTLPHKDMFGH